MPDGFKIASGWVEVLPDMSGFRARLQAELEAATSGSGARAKIGGDTTALDEKIAAAGAALGDLGKRSTAPKVTLDDSEAASKIDNFRAKLLRLSQDGPTPKVSADVADATAKVASIEARIDHLNTVIARPEITPQMAQAQAGIDALTAKLEALGKEKPSPKVDANTTAAQQKLSLLNARLDDLKTRDTEVKVKAGADLLQAQADLDKLGVKIDEIGARHVEAKVTIDTGDSQEKLVALDEELQSKPGDADRATRAFGGFSGMMYAVAAAIPVAAAGLPALGGALAGLAGTAGAAGLAFGGIAQAITDYSAVQDNAGQSAAQMAATVASNAVAITSAQRAISDAEKQAAQDARTSAQSIVSAQEQVAQSEHSYTESLYSEQQAQAALIQAREQARLQLQALNNAEIDGHLSVRAAQLALQQAQLQQQQTDANALSTQLQREQAALAVAQAERQLIEARQGESHATDAANKANKEGVSGNPQVIAAQHALRDAIYQAQQARQAERDAIKALSAARQQAAYQQQRDAEAVRVAQQNLADTERQQQLQMAASGNAATKFARDMAELTGPQRALVREFMSFNGVLKTMEAIAGKAILPGVTQFLHGVHAILPTVESGLAKFGRVAGSIFAEIGHAFQSKAFRRDLDSIITQGARFMRILEPLGGAVGKLFGLWAKGGPATAGLARGLAAIATGFGNLFQGLAPAIKPAGEILATLGKAIGDLGGPLGQVLSALLQSLAPVLKALLPGFKVLADTLGSALAQALRGIAPALVPLAQDLSQIVIALAPLLPLLAQIIGVAGSALAPLLTSIRPLLRELTPVIGSLVKSITPLVTVLGDVITVIADVLGFIIELLTRTRTWKDVWSAFAGFFTALWHDVDSYLRTVLSPWGEFISGVFHVIEDVASIFQGNFREGIRTLVHDVGQLWHGLEDLFKLPVNFLIKTVYDNGIARLWNDVVTHVGLGSIKLPPIPTLAAGGRLPGYGGGDKHPALLEAGETVVDKDRSLALAPLFRAIGVPGYAAGGKAGSPATTPEGNSGGLVGWVRHFLGDAFDLGKIVAALATGNTTAFSNALGHFVHTPATGDLAKVMMALPQTLISDAVKAVVGLFGGGGTGGGGDIVNYAKTFLGVPYVTGGVSRDGVDCSGLTDLVFSHFGYNIPRTSEEQFAWAKKSGPAPGALVFMVGDGTYAPPGHVGIMTGLNRMINAPGTGIPTEYDTPLGVMGYGVPPGGFHTAPHGGAPVGAAQAYARSLFGRFGWGASQWPPLQSLWTRESGWDASAVNPSSGAYGIPQALPGVWGHPYAMGDYQAQDLWGENYIHGRYGTPAAAWSHEQSAGWYDSGGWLPPGMLNGTGRPEAVLTHEESRALVTMAKSFAAGMGGGPVVHQHFHGQHPNVEQQAQMRRDLALLLGG